MFAVLLVFFGMGCKTSKESAPVLGKVGEKPVYLNEFEYVYNKNNSNSENAYSRESVEEYLRLYTNFRLKVAEAEALGLDTNQSFIKELDGYKKQLAQPYFTEKEVTDRLTRMEYERMKKEINASHILLSVAPEASPEDTMAVYKRIMDIREKALKGGGFGALAVEFSEDPSAKVNKGNLGYFTALQMVHQFEDAAYSTEPGKISKPVRTRFGYHILKVHDIRPSQGQIRAAHIMVRATEGISPEDSVAAKEKIDELYAQLSKGEDWASLVSQFSDDNNSKNKGGELPWFSAGRMIPAFEDAAFSLEEAGQISKPVKTPYGWHIIKLLEKKPLEPFEEVEPKIRSRVARDMSDLNKKALIERLIKENQFESFPSAINRAISFADSSLLEGKWDTVITEKKDPVLFYISKESFKTSDFFSYVKQNQAPKKNFSPEGYMRNLYEQYKENRLIDYEQRHLEEKHEDYRLLVKEYRDGILLFQLMDEKVWSKALQDTAGLRVFFNENREKYAWGSRAKAAIFSVSGKETLAKVQEMLSATVFPSGEPELEPVQFSKNADTLGAVSIKRLGKLVPYLTQNSHLLIELKAVSGKSESKNLANKRADNIKKWLVEKGIDSSRFLPVKTETMGNEGMVSFNLFTTSYKALEKTFNKNAPLTLEVAEGLFQKGDNEILDQIEWKPDTTTIEKNGRIHYVIISEVQEPRLKELNETRGMVISDYQEYLEQEWLKELKTKYPVNYNQDEIDKLIKQ